jgi:hypothetical protein
MATVTRQHDGAETEIDPRSVDRAFRRAAIVQDAKISVRRRRLGARRRQRVS